MTEQDQEFVEFPDEEPYDNQDQIPEDIYERPGYDSMIYSCKLRDVDPFFDFLTISKGGKVLLGASNLNGRHWSGTIGYYEDPLSVPAVENCKSGFLTSGGVVDGTFVVENKAIVAEDGGIVDFIAMGQEGMTKHHIEENSATVCRVAVSCDHQTMLTASKDCSVRLYDTETTATKSSLLYAHSNELTGLSVHPTNNSIFITSGLDGNVLLWDMRLPKPAHCIFKDKNDPPMEVSYLESNPDHYIVGSFTGSIMLRGTAQPAFSLHEIKPFSRPLHRFTSNPHKTNQIACAAESNELVVLEAEKEQLSIRYKDYRHKDYARDFGWLSETEFLSCGWDKQVLQHSIN